MTPPYYADERITIHHGDCIDVLTLLPDASVDAVVTDPPYGLGFMGKEWDAGKSFVERKAAKSNRFDHVGGNHNPANSKDQQRTRLRENAAFGDWCVEWTTECLRVLKPGGHLLAFGGTRTWHRLAAAVEDAGFEVRDSMAWLYGSGFPKSMDVSKAIDKARDDRDAIRVVCRWLRSRIDEHPTASVRSLAEQFGFHPRMVEHWAARDTDSQPSLPTLEQWDALRAALGFSDELDAEVLRLNLRKGEPGEAWSNRPVTGQVEEWANRTNYALTSRDGLRRDVPSSDNARTWQGWGTALKPAFEPIVVARKPLAATVAANVLAHGTGALNIDGCRVGQESTRRRNAAEMGYHGGNLSTDYQTGSESGRWPANVVLNDHQAAVLDQQSGVLTSGKMRAGTRPKGERETYGQDAAAGYETTRDTPGDTGGASRFFYVAKADQAERVRVDGVAHPTVKPLSLMRWLVRLVTPPGGVVLEPFAGSGTTVEACILEGFRCIAIEREDAYLPLIRQRIARRLDPVAAVRGSGDDGGLFDLIGEAGA